jgi:hypothetical protein
VKHLPSKCRVLSSNPQKQKRKVHFSKTQLHRVHAPEREVKGIEWRAGDKEKLEPKGK